MSIELLISFIPSTYFFYILLDYILHYIPPHICIFLFHYQCFEFYLKQTMLLLEFIVFSKDIVIFERFNAMGLFHNMLQPFINNLLPLQVSIHPCLSLLKLLLYFILGLAYITNIISKLLQLLLLLQESLFHILIIFLNFIVFHIQKIIICF